MDYRKIFARLVENWPAKVLSLGLAIILFVFHRMNSLETRSFLAPITIENLNAMMPSSPYPRMIRVNLKGEGKSLYSFLEDDIEPYVDMEEFSVPGAYKVPIKWRKKGTAQDVEPLQITVDPMEITFSLDYKISKFVSLIANFEGQVESGYNMTSYSFNPNQVIIEGPVSLLGGISELQTESIDLSGRRSDFSVTASVLRPSSLIVIRGEGTTEFSGAISQLIPVRNITNVPIIITGIQEGFTAELEIKNGSIHLEGENRAAIEGFVPAPDFLRVDCSGISEPGIYILRVIAGNVMGISLRTEPQEVKIQIDSIGD